MYLQRSIIFETSDTPPSTYTHPILGTFAQHYYFRRAIFEYLSREKVQNQHVKRDLYHTHAFSDSREASLVRDPK